MYEEVWSEHMSKFENNHLDHFETLSEEAVRSILGIQQAVPLSPEAMAESLRVTFYPVSSASDRVTAFARRLRQALASRKVNIVEYEQALAAGVDGKLPDGLVIITAGDLQTGDLPVDHVSNLRTTTVVSIINGPCPADNEDGLQERLNSIVRTLAWSIIQGVIYVDDSSWTICTMNGAVIKCKDDSSFVPDVFSKLVPKLAAPVVPPHSADFDFHEGALDLSSEKYSPYVNDFTESGELWARTGLMLFHTSLESLTFRNRYYRRIAAAYLDHRSGMSYGFLARQIPTPVKPACTVEEADKIFGTFDWNATGLRRIEDRLFAALNVNGATLVAEVPDVSVLTTRSGCDKSHIDAHRDIILMGLSRGKVMFETPRGISPRIDCKPSYDTQTILSHAVGNSLVASVQARVSPRASFVTMFQKSGMALAHWHGGVNHAVLPQGYFVHGENNPPVSCSTHQASIFALTGKMSTLKRSLDQQVEFQGDVHIEPHHGINVTGGSLVALAQWVLRNIESLTEAKSSVEDVVEREGAAVQSG